MPADLLRVDVERFQRIIAISDLHGDLLALDALIRYIRPTRQDLIVTIGDYVDRGSDSFGVIERLIELHTHHDVNIVSLRGNHDQMMIEALNSPEDLDFWLQLGGQSTLASYPDQSIRAVPEAHWHFLRSSCVDLLETEDYLFVHGHLDPSDAVELQDIQTLHWLRFDQSDAHCSGKTIVCGHHSTRSGKPESMGHTIAIETKQHINAVELTTGSCWRADERAAISRCQLLIAL